MLIFQREREWGGICKSNEPKIFTKYIKHVDDNDRNKTLTIQKNGTEKFKNNLTSENCGGRNPGNLSIGLFGAKRNQYAVGEVQFWRRRLVLGVTNFGAKYKVCRETHKC